MAVIDHICSVHCIISIGKLMVSIFLKNKIKYISLIEKTMCISQHMWKLVIIKR